MTERINVASKIVFNRIHAISALILWIVIGIIACVLMSDSYALDDFAWLGIVGGIILGVSNLFIINNKYAWQVATIDEIRELKIILEKDIKKEIDEIKKSLPNDNSENVISSNIWICANCGEKNSLDTKYCKKCDCPR